MINMKIFRFNRTAFLLAIALLVSGCTFSSNYYVLSISKQPSVTYEQTKRSIGVEKVTVPKYLFKRELAVAKSSSQVAFLSGAVWAEDMDEGLTNRLIGFLQKKFQQPRVYPYPWGVSDQPGLKIKVQISRFIAQGNKIYLDANWEIEDMKSHKKIARLFNTSVMTKSDATSIVDAMDRAFGELEEKVAKGVKLFH